MAITQQGMELIRHFEGLRLDAYRDPVGIWTIGYGHTRTAKAGMKITVQQAVELLEEDIAGHEKIVDRAVKVDIDPEQRSALVSFAFNVGDGSLRNSTLLRLLNAGKLSDVGPQFERWIYGTKNGRKVELPGLVRRRKAERHLFETGSIDVFAPRAQGLTRDDHEEDIEGDFTERFATWGIHHFKAHELLVMGNQNSNAGSPAHNLNTLPPEALWSNIEPTVRVLDRLRERIGSPIQTLSIYRSPAYNTAIGGARHSQHMDFNAIDFTVKNTSLHPAQWAALLRELRSAHVFKGGIGTYPSFVHLDTRGTNVDW